MSQLRSPLAEARTGRPFSRLLTVVAALAVIGTMVGTTLPAQASARLDQERGRCRPGCAGRGAVLLAGQGGGQGRLDQLGQSLQRADRHAEVPELLRRRVLRAVHGEQRRHHHAGRDGLDHQGRLLRASGQRPDPQLHRIGDQGHGDQRPEHPDHAGLGHVLQPLLRDLRPQGGAGPLHGDGCLGRPGLGTGRRGDHRHQHQALRGLGRPHPHHVVRRRARRPPCAVHRLRGRRPPTVTSNSGPRTSGRSGCCPSSRSSM